MVLLFLATVISVSFFITYVVGQFRIQRYGGRFGMWWDAEGAAFFTILLFWLGTMLLGTFGL